MSNTTPTGEPSEERGASSSTERSSSPGADGEGGKAGARGWMIVTGALAITLVVVGIYALGAKSDRDDAEQALKVAAAAPATTPAPAPTPAATTAAAESPAAPSAEAQQQFEQIEEDLGATQQELDQVQEDLDDAAAKADDAKQKEAEAQGAADKLRAEVTSLGARLELASTCLKAQMQAFGESFTAAGIDGAVAQLQQVVATCKDAGSG